MTQSQLNRAVANKTGEDFEEIARRGFSLVDDEDQPEDDDDLRLFLDWDEHEATQNIPLFRDRQRGRVA